MLCNFRYFCMRISLYPFVIALFFVFGSYYGQAQFVPYNYAGWDYLTTPLSSTEVGINMQTWLNPGQNPTLLVHSKYRQASGGWSPAVLRLQTWNFPSTYGFGESKIQFWSDNYDPTVTNYQWQVGEIRTVDLGIPPYNSSGVYKAGLAFYCSGGWTRSAVDQGPVEVMRIINKRLGINVEDPGALVHVNEGTVLFDGSPASTLVSHNIGETPAQGPGTRLMWIPTKGAFRAGKVTGDEWDDQFIGNYSFAANQSTKASGDYSTAFGNGSQATGDYSIAGGLNSIASGNKSFAFGNGSQATADYSFAFGDQSIAAYGSAAFGVQCEATGETSFATGSVSKATGDYSIAMGLSSAFGWSSIAIGYETGAMGDNSVAIGGASSAGSDWSMALNGGQVTEAADGGIAIGGLVVYAPYGVAMGMGSYSSGYGSMALGDATSSGTFSYALGNEVEASGDYSFAFGNNNTSSGTFSTTMGNYVSTNSQEGSFIVGDHSTTTVTNSTTKDQITLRFAGDPSLVPAGHTNAAYRFYTNSALSTGVYMSPGQSGWKYISDRKAKENFQDLDYNKILNSIRNLQIRSWNYKETPKEIRYIGPMAQDFYREFNLGGSDSLGINTINMNGVNMAAIKGLLLKVDKVENENKELKERVDNLERVVSSKSFEFTNSENIFDDIILEQNNPNPFDSETLISYFIPSEINGNFELVLTDLNSTTVYKKYQLHSGSPDYISVAANDLGTGVYLYGITVNGKLVVSKKMMVIK